MKMSMIFGVFDADGRPQGFYDPSLSLVIPPEGAVELTDEQRAEFVDHPGRRVWRNGAVSSADLPAPTPAEKVAELTAACAAVIVSGYTSSALGDVHSYPNDQIAQINMMGSVTGSLLSGLPADWTTPFWCADGSGIWQMRPHTASQIQRAGRDGKAHVVACQQQLVTLKAAVAAATTPEAVAAVVWMPPEA